MNFCYNDFYQLENKCERVLRSVLKLAGTTSLSSLTEQDIMRADKDTMSVIILSLVDAAESSLNVLRSAAVAIEKSRTDQISSQETVIKLQEKLIYKQEQLGSVQFNLENCQQPGNKLESIVKSVVNENERQKQVVLFGVPEEITSNLGTMIADVLECACAENKPRVKDYCRIGAIKPGKNRPVKVRLASREEAQNTISSAKTLKNSEKFRKEFIAPDRSPAERAERRKLVQLLREKKKNEPEMHHYISRGEVFSTNHYSERAPPPSAPECSETDNSQVVAALANEFRKFEESFLSSFNRLDTSIENMTERLT